MKTVISHPVAGITNFIAIARSRLSESVLTQSPANTYISLHVHLISGDNYFYNELNRVGKKGKMPLYNIS